MAEKQPAGCLCFWRKDNKTDDKGSRNGPSVVQSPQDARDGAARPTSPTLPVAPNVPSAAPIPTAVDPCPTDSPPTLLAAGVRALPADGTTTTNPRTNTSASTPSAAAVPSPVLSPHPEMRAEEEDEAEAVSTTSRESSVYYSAGGWSQFGGDDAEALGSPVGQSLSAELADDSAVAVGISGDVDGPEGPAGPSSKPSEPVAAGQSAATTPPGRGTAHISPRSSQHQEQGQNHHLHQHQHHHLHPHHQNHHHLPVLKEQDSVAGADAAPPAEAEEEVEAVSSDQAEPAGAAPMDASAPLTVASQEDTVPLALVAQEPTVTLVLASQEDSVPLVLASQEDSDPREGSMPVVLAAQEDATPVVLAAQENATPAVLAAQKDATPVVLAAQEDATPVVLVAQENATPVVLAAQENATPVVLAAQENATPVVLAAQKDATPVVLAAAQEAGSREESTQQPGEQQRAASSPVPAASVAVADPLAASRAAMLDQVTELYAVRGRPCKACQVMLQFCRAEDVEPDSLKQELSEREMPDAAALTKVVQGVSDSLADLSSDDGWQVVRNDELRLLYKHLPGPGVHAFRGVCELDAPTEHLVALAREADLCPTWNRYCTFANVIREMSVTDVMVYMSLWVPWPFNDVGFFVQANGADLYDEEGCLVITFSTPDKSEGPLEPPAGAEQHRKVRLQRPSCMRLVPLPPKVPGGPQRTRATVQTYVDPGMRNVPPFIISFVLKVLSPFVYGAVQKVLKSAFKTPGNPLPSRIKERSDLYDLVRRRTEAHLRDKAKGAKEVAGTPSAPATSGRG